MNCIFNWTIEIAREIENEQDNIPTNLASDALSKFFDLLGLKTDGKEKEKDNAIPLFRTGEKEIRLLILTPYSVNILEEYFKNLLLEAYSKTKTEDLSKQRFLFVDWDLTNTDWRLERFFHVLGSVFKHSGMGWKVQVEKLLAFLSPEFIKNIKGNLKPGSITNNELRNCIEETCFATGVEEMREFFFRDTVTSLLHHLFHKLPKDRRNALRLIFGAYLAGDISSEVLDIVIKNFFPQTVPPIDLITGDIDKRIPDRMKNPLWKYLENRKILIIDDGWEKEGWNIVLPALLLSPGKIDAALPPNIMCYKSIHDALQASEVDNKFDLKDIDLIILDLYSSSDGGHTKSVQITNMKDPLWEHREKISEIRTRYIRESIPQPMPQIVVFSRDNNGTTARTMFKELNTVDYFFKHTGTEEHKCGYYSYFRNALISALKETVYEVGGMTDISSRLRFNRWLRQFDPCDRPVILHLMKHFKYFPATNIMELLDKYLKNNTRREDNAVSILNSHLRKPNQFYISYLGSANKSGPATLPLLSKTEWIKELREKIENPSSKKLPGFISYERLQGKIKRSINRRTLAGNPICIIFVDDVVASGGQLENYMGKFLKDLIKSPKEEALTQIQSLEIIALFALGVQNKKYFENMIGKSVRNDDETHSINGSFDVKFEEVSATVQVHAAHYTRSIQEIFKDNQEFLNEVEETLRKYAVSMELRDEDYPCNFIPWGWKENGGLLATYANAQGNTIPVIWQDYKSRNDDDVIQQKNGFSIKRWEHLYPRYFNPLTPGKKQYDKKNKKKNKDTKIFECKKMKKCPVNPLRWNEQFFEKYWKIENDPPCKTTAR